MANEVEEKKSWPQTSDREFSKRMFKRFMWAFFIHVFLTLASEVCMKAFGFEYGQPTTILITCIPVYTAVFMAVIAKSGVENVYKGKTAAGDSVTVGKSANTKIVNQVVENG